MRQSEAVKHAERGPRTLDDLRALDGEKLSVEARTGLKHYDDLQTKIPRDEVDVWNVASLVCVGPNSRSPSLPLRKWSIPIFKQSSLETSIAPIQVRC